MDNRIIEKLKSEERNSKRSIETLATEADEKRDMIYELDERLNSLTDQLMVRKEELSGAERLLEEFSKEKEVHRKNKLENAQLSKEVKWRKNTIGLIRYLVRADKAKDRGNDL